MHNLRERVKELEVLHRVARMLQDDAKPMARLFEEIVGLLPAAWQFPEVVAACIRFGDLERTTSNFKPVPWRQTASFTTRDGRSGSIEVVYLEPRPPASEGPFLVEKRNLIDSLAEMFRACLQRKLDIEELQKAHDDLKRLVSERTAELSAANEILQQKVAELTRTRGEIEVYQAKLRQMSIALSMAQERERRAIASDLHDHLGQGLAYIKIRIIQLRGDAVFSGFEETIGEVLKLLNQSIAYTRTLTFEISPPVLYDLGLSAALDWLGEEFQKKYGLNVLVKGDKRLAVLREEVKLMLFRSVQELLFNVSKHADAEQVTITMEREEGHLHLSVSDDGQGFDPANLENDGNNSRGFGLFSIRERFSALGGHVEISSSPGQGTRVTIQVPDEER